MPLCGELQKGWREQIFKISLLSAGACPCRLTRSVCPVAAWGCGRRRFPDCSADPARSRCTLA